MESESPSKKQKTSTSRILNVKDIHVFVTDAFEMELKMLSKTVVKPMQNGKGNHFGATFQDKEGHLIRASFFGTAAASYEEFKLNKTYLIKNVKARSVGPRFETKDSKFQLVFNNKVDVSPIHSNGFKKPLVQCTPLAALSQKQHLTLLGFCYNWIQLQISMAIFVDWFSKMIL